MADNYLEKRYEEVFGSGARKTVVRKANPSLDSLLLRNRSHRAFNREHVVRLSDLETIAGVNTKLPSAMNRQPLRFRLVIDGDECAKVLELMHMGAALKEMSLPPEGAEPLAYIIVCTKEREDRYIDIDLGISLQSMALKAVETGLNATIVCSFSRSALAAALELPGDYTPLALLAVGKGADKIQLLSIDESESRSYYRKDGIHYVPKVCIKDLIIK